MHGTPRGEHAHQKPCHDSDDGADEEHTGIGRQWVQQRRDTRDRQLGIQRARGPKRERPRDRESRGDKQNAFDEELLHVST